MEQNLVSEDNECFDTKEAKESESCLDSGDSFDRTDSGMLLRTFLDQKSSWVEASEEGGDVANAACVKAWKRRRKVKFKEDENIEEVAIS